MQQRGRLSVCVCVCARLSAFRFRALPGFFVLRVFVYLPSYLIIENLRKVRLENAANFTEVAVSQLVQVGAAPALCTYHSTVRTRSHDSQY